MGRHQRDYLRRRRGDRIRGGVAHAGGRPQLPQCRQGAGVERAAGHAPAAHAGASHDTRPGQSATGARHRVWRGRHRRRRLGGSTRAERDDRRDRTAGAARRVEVFRRLQLQRRREPEGHRAPRRCAALSADDEREVRRDYVGSARSVGQGGRDALHARVLRGRQGASQPGRGRHAVRAVVREQRCGGEERSRDVSRRVSRRRRVREHVERPWLRPRAARTAESAADQRRRGAGAADCGGQRANREVTERDLEFIPRQSSLRRTRDANPIWQGG